jgi:hypothetical protein
MSSNDSSRYRDYYLNKLEEYEQGLKEIDFRLKGLQTPDNEQKYNQVLVPLQTLMAKIREEITARKATPLPIPVYNRKNVPFSPDIPELFWSRLRSAWTIIFPSKKSNLH